MKIVLEKPAIKVSTAMAAPRLRENQVAMTAKAGSYSTAAPKDSHQRHDQEELRQAVHTRDQSKTQQVAPIEPTVMEKRAPCRSSHQPTGSAPMPVISSDSEKRARNLRPRPARTRPSIGVMNTENA